MAMNIDELKKLKAKARLIEPLVRVGKNGITEQMIEHIHKMILKRKLVKIKFLESFLESKAKKEAAKELAFKTGSDVVDVVGNVVVLYRR